MGYPKRTKEQIATALAHHNGNITKAAKDLGYERPTLSDKVNKDPELKKLCQTIREGRLDLAEDVIGHHLEAKNAKVAMWLLGMSGQARGYVRSQVVGVVPGDGLDMEELFAKGREEASVDEIRSAYHSSLH